MPNFTQYLFIVSLMFLIINLVTYSLNYGVSTTWLSGHSAKYFHEFNTGFQLNGPIGLPFSSCFWPVILALSHWPSCCNTGSVKSSSSYMPFSISSIMIATALESASPFHNLHAWGLCLLDIIWNLLLCQNLSYHYLPSAYHLFLDHLCMLVMGNI